MDNEQLNRLQDWLETQKVYWQSLMNGEETEATDWNTLLDSCRKLAEQQLPPQNAEIAETMAQQAKGFCKYGELLLKTLSKDTNPPELEEAVFEFSRHLQDQTGAAFIKQWQLPEQLVQFFSNLGISIPTLPGFPFFEQGFRSSQDHLKEKFSEAEQNFRDFRDALSDYAEIQDNINQATTHQLLATLKAGEDPASLEDLYRLWVDHYESCYQQQLQTPSYQKTYSRLSNACLALQKLNHEYWEQEYRNFGLVPIKDYDLLLERHHKLRKSFKQSDKRSVELEFRLQRSEQTHLERLAAMDSRIKQLEEKLLKLEPASE